MGAERQPPSADPTSPRPVTFVAHELGEGRLEPGIPDGRLQKVLRIDLTGAPTNLLGRLLVGSYITGQDQVVITARHGLTRAQRDEIHRVVDRTLGMTVVADTSAVVEVQNFIDPGKHELPRLLYRMVQLLRIELTVLRDAMRSEATAELSQIESTEEEIDRLYLLVVRQLLLSSENPRIAKSIDVESHHYQIGDRLVAKVLEMTGDLVYEIGKELQAHRAGLRRIPRPVLGQLVSRMDRLNLFLARTMEAFGHLSVVEANANLNEIAEASPNDPKLVGLICRHVPDRKVAMAAQRIASNLGMALEMLIIINEVTINRSVEPEPIAHSGHRAALGSPGSIRSRRTSHTSIAILATAPGLLADSSS
jgi:phosphate uptake regulator